MLFSFYKLQFLLVISIHTLLHKWQESDKGTNKLNCLLNEAIFLTGIVHLAEFFQM